MDTQTIYEAVEHGDNYAPIQSDFGQLFVAYSRLGVSAVRPARNEATFEAWFRGQIGRPIERSAALPVELGEALRRQLQHCDSALPLDLLASSDFERAVLLTTWGIPRGEVRTYGWIARKIGEPTAAKDVGIALSRNPILHVIPCHRVVRSDGSLGGYAGGGVRVKRGLLLGEGYQPEIPGLRTHAAL